MTIDDLLYHTFLRFDDDGKEIDRKFSTKNTTNYAGLTHIISSKENSTDTLLNVNGKLESYPLLKQNFRKIGILFVNPRIA